MLRLCGHFHIGGDKVKERTHFDKQRRLDHQDTIFVKRIINSQLKDVKKCLTEQLTETRCKHWNG